MNHHAGGETTVTTIHYLLVGVQGIGEVQIVRWFVEEGQRLRARDPLVTLLSGRVDGPSITLRVSAEDSIEGAVVERIFCAEGTLVAEGDCLAVFTTSTVEVGRSIRRLEDLGDLAQYPEVFVDCVIASTSLLRELLDRRFPGFARWYFKTHPLVPLIEMAATLAILGLGALLAHSVLDSLVALNGPPTSTPWWDNLWLLLGPFFLGVLVVLVLGVLRWLALSRISPLARSSRRRQVEE